MVHVRGAREHNLTNIDVDIPRDSLVVFTGICGSGKSSLAFGTLYAEAQRRYLESVSPHARRLFHQMAVPEVDEIDGLASAVALQQQRGSPTTRPSVGSVTTLSNLLRMLYSRAGHYPRGQPLLYAESFSPNTPEGACQGTFSSARRHVLHSFANTQSPLMKKRALQYMLSRACSLCHGKRLRPQSLAVKFAGLDIADLSRLSLQALTGIFQPYADGSDARAEKIDGGAPRESAGHAADQAGSRRATGGVARSWWQVRRPTWHGRRAAPPPAWLAFWARPSGNDCRETIRNCE
jgi:excinuclease UvrABC ATPase subunit